MSDRLLRPEATELVVSTSSTFFMGLRPAEGAQQHETARLLARKFQKGSPLTERRGIVRGGWWNAVDLGVSTTVFRSGDGHPQVVPCFASGGVIWAQVAQGGRVRNTFNDLLPSL